MPSNVVDKLKHAFNENTIGRDVVRQSAIKYFSRDTRKHWLTYFINNYMYRFRLYLSRLFEIRSCVAFMRFLKSLFVILHTQCNRDFFVFKVSHVTLWFRLTSCRCCIAAACSIHFIKLAKWIAFIANQKIFIASRRTRISVCH